MSIFVLVFSILICKEQKGEKKNKRKLETTCNKCNIMTGMAETILLMALTEN